MAGISILSLYDFTDIEDKDPIVVEVEIYEPWVAVEKFVNEFIYETTIREIGRVDGLSWFDGGFRFYILGESNLSDIVPMWLALCGIKEFKHRIKTEDRTYE